MNRTTSNFKPQIEKIYAEKKEWQTGKLNIAKGEQVVITASGLWTTHPPGACGPSGYLDRIAGPNYVKPGLPEGCLLVQDSRGNITHFETNESEVVIQVPGDVQYMANDDISGRGDFDTKGFRDNEGFLTVKQVKNKL